MGYMNLIGSDFSEKAVRDTKENLKWLSKELRISNYELRIEKINVLDLAKNFTEKSVDAIITEPFLGQPMRGNEKPETINGIIADLKKLYLLAFSQFKIVLKKPGKIVIVIPEWHIGGSIFKMDIEKDIKALGLERLDKDDLIYRREDQKVWRKIEIWKNL